MAHDRAPGPFLPCSPAGSRGAIPLRLEQLCFSGLARRRRRFLCPHDSHSAESGTWITSVYFRLVPNAATIFAVRKCAVAVAFRKRCAFRPRSRRNPSHASHGRATWAGETHRTPVPTANPGESAACGQRPAAEYRGRVVREASDGLVSADSAAACAVRFQRPCALVESRILEGQSRLSVAVVRVGIQGCFP